MAAAPAQPNQPNPLDVLTQTITKSVLESINQRLEVNNGNLLKEVKGLLSESTPDIAERASKRIKLDNPELNNPGNADQYQHNADVLRNIEKAANCILKGDGEGGIKSLNEGKKLISQRHKLVRLADHEEKGWKFVREYVKDKLAEDSDDEKQIRKARRIVQEKFPTRRPPQRYPNRQSNRPNFRRNQSFRENSSYQHREQQPSYSSRGGYSSHQPRTDFRRDRYDRECHLCRRRGHLSFDCPERNQRQ